jgi:hypothetical protein
MSDDTQVTVEDLLNEMKAVNAEMLGELMHQISLQRAINRKHVVIIEQLRQQIREPLDQ